MEVSKMSRISTNLLGMLATIPSDISLYTAFWSVVGLRNTESISDLSLNGSVAMTWKALSM